MSPERREDHGHCSFSSSVVFARGRSIGVCVPLGPCLDAARCSRTKDMRRERENDERHQRRGFSACVARCGFAVERRHGCCAWVGGEPDDAQTCLSVVSVCSVRACHVPGHATCPYASRVRTCHVSVRVTCPCASRARACHVSVCVTCPPA